MVEPDDRVSRGRVTIGELRISGPIEPWLNLGLVARADSLICLVDLGLRFVSTPDTNESSPGIVGWTLVNSSSDTPVLPPAADRATDSISVDGIATAIVTQAPCLESPDSPLGVSGVDHVVIMTGQLERTCAAITAVTGAPLKRIRDAGRGVRQGFHRCGNVIIEVVERPDIDAATSAAIWGLVLTVEDLDTAVRWLGPDVISAPRSAVQEGRSIATIKNGAGLGVAVALMSPG